MKDDRWATQMTARLVALRLLCGSRETEEQLEMEEEIKEIEKSFEERFGRVRGRLLLTDIHRMADV